MLTDAAWERETGIPVALIEGTEFEAFSMFDIRLDLAVERVRTPDGKVIRRKMFPQLEGRPTSLFELRYNEGPTVRQVAMTEAKQTELDRKARLAKYIQQGYADDERALTDPDGGAEEDIPTDEGDEWTRFFADDVPMRGGRCATRKGGHRNHGGFENFVDSAQ